MNQRKLGVVVQYINIVLDFCVAMVFTPFLIRSLGDAEYGLYRIVQSFAGQLTILSFGIATLVARNIVRYDTLNKKEEKENFLAMAAVETILISASVLVIGAGLSLGIESLFGTSLSGEEMTLAKKLYWILIINVSVSVFADMGSGILVAHEKFVIKNGLSTLKQLFRILVLVVLLNLNLGAMAIVLTDLVLNVIIMCAQYIYMFCVLQEKIVFHYFDATEFKTSITFSIAILLQAIVNQVNQNMDSIILGAMTTTEIVTMYSIALNLFTMFNSITMVFGSVFVPKATKMITQGATGDELTSLVVRPGRYAVIVGSLIISGFVIFGKEFIRFWVGEQYISAYSVAIILMIPGMLPLMQNVTNAILDAMMKRLGRSIILLIMAGVNVFISVVLVKKIGYIGAAFGTAFSYVFGYLVLLNIHLKRETTLKLRKMYRGLLNKNFLAAIICLILGIALNQIVGTAPSFALLLIKMALYTALYSVVMYCVGLNNQERYEINNIGKKLIGRVHK